MTAIKGNTYPVKDQLRALGGRWDAEAKAWMVPDDKAEEARKLVADAPASKPPSRPTRCKVCGAQARDGRYRYGGTVIYRSGECRDCYEERKMGY